MGRSCFLRYLLVSSLLVLFFSHGFGRKLMETVEHEDSTAQVEETMGKSREMIQVMDYSDPVSNTNPYGYFSSPPPA